MIEYGSDALGFTGLRVIEQPARSVYKGMKIEKGKSFRGMRIKRAVKGLSPKIFLATLLAMHGFFLTGTAGKVGTGFGEEIYFFCGAAVRVPMDEIIPNYEKESGNKVNVIYSGSGTLLAQMELSKRGDVYLCGSPDYVIIGEKKGLLIPGSEKIISYLVPAIIVPKGNPKNIRKLEDLGRPDVRVGMGNPEAVCLGLYGLEILDKNNLMEKVLPQVVVFAKSCEDTATLAVLNKVDAILGWDVFESWNPDRVRWIKINPAQIGRLSYIPVAVPVFVRNRRLAEEFIDYVINNPESKKIWRKYGHIRDIKKVKKYVLRVSTGGVYEIPSRYWDVLKKAK
ncbi:MAG: molybdate ABC transporter substrate-binding protein [Elusimicrobiota bacterium]